MSASQARRLSVNVERFDLAAPFVISRGGRRVADVVSATRSAAKCALSIDSIVSEPNAITDRSVQLLMFLPQRFGLDASVSPALNLYVSALATEHSASNVNVFTASAPCGN